MVWWLSLLHNYIQQSLNLDSAAGREPQVLSCHEENHHQWSRPKRKHNHFMYNVEIWPEILQSMSDHFSTLYMKGLMQFRRSHQYHHQEIDILGE